MNFIELSLESIPGSYILIVKDTIEAIVYDAYNEVYSIHTKSGRYVVTNSLEEIMEKLNER